MIIDFDADLLEYAQLELRALGVQPPNDIPTDCALLLFKLQRRCPIARPRETKLAKSFCVAPELEQGLSGLIAAIHRGQSLAPYLSRSTFKPERADSLLDDWGLLHFHLGTKLIPGGFVEGTKVVAFALVRPDCVYFIAAEPHGREFPAVWVQEKFIHIVEENWPALLPTNYAHLTPDILTSQERLILRRKSMNATVAKASGEVIFPPGGGVMCDGTAMSDFMQLQKLSAQFDYARKICSLNEDAIRVSLGVATGDFRIRMGFSDKQLFLYEPRTGTQIEFVQPVDVQASIETPGVRRNYAQKALLFGVLALIGALLLR